jgi:NAD(P)H dehydrogenase (quinone)
MVLSFVYTIPGVRWLQTKLNQQSSYFPPPPEASAGEEPRKVLLVQAHPVVHASFSAAIAIAFTEAALAAGHQVKRISLYDHNDVDKCYRPNLSQQERLSYFNLAGNPDATTSGVAADVKAHVDLLKWCDTLVFIYPTWWMNTPASIKGFLDRTLVPGLTWDFPSKEDAGASLGLIPHLTNIERIVGISTYGAPQMTVMLAGDNGRRMISNAVRHSVAPNARVTWLGLYHFDAIQDRQRAMFLDQVKQLPKEL